ncbi:MAG: tripartite tricarboxylate transporter substrate binding protein [Bacillota bacterium]
MRSGFKNKIFTVVMVLVLALAAAGCQSQKASAPGDAGKGKDSFPSKPLEFVAHTNPGDGADIFMRTLADTLTKDGIVKQPINVVNKVGGSGAVMMGYLQAKAGDPHYLMPAQVSLLTTPLRNNLGVTYKDFTPVALLVTDEMVVAVRNESPYKSMKDIIEAAKKQPKSVNQGGGVYGGSDSILGYLIEKATGVKFNFITFKGGGEAVVALLGGNCDFIAMNPAEVAGQVEAKKMRLVAVASDKRLEAYPDVPTLKEQGIDVVFQSFRGVAAPKDISKEALASLEQYMKKAMESETWKKYIKDNSLTPNFKNSADFAAYLDRQNELYKNVYKEMGLQGK